MDWVARVFLDKTICSLLSTFLSIESLFILSATTTRIRSKWFSDDNKGWLGALQMKERIIQRFSWGYMNKYKNFESITKYMFEDKCYGRKHKKSGTVRLNPGHWVCHACIFRTTELIPICNKHVYEDTSETIAYKGRMEEMIQYKKNLKTTLLNEYQKNERDHIRWIEFVRNENIFWRLYQFIVEFYDNECIQYHGSPYIKKDTLFGKIFKLHVNDVIERFWDEPPNKKIKTLF
jgi:hypothetical protein